MFIPNLISIIVPIYNSSSYLSECIESLRNQTYNNLEIILVNDGSEDNSLSICSHFQEIDKRIVIIDQENQGVSTARNNGLKIAKGEYIGFVDSDDTIDLNMYEKLINKVINEQSQIATLANFTIKPSDLYLNSPISTKEAIESLLLLKFPTSMCVYLYRHDTLKNISISEDIYFFEDFEFNFKVLKRCSNISVIFDNLYFYRANLLSANHQKLNHKILSCLKIHSKIRYEIAHDKDLYERSIFFHAHCVVSMILKFAISNSISIEHFNMKLNLQVFKKQLNNKYIPYQYKIIILAFYKYPMSTLFILRTLHPSYRNLKKLLRLNINKQTISNL